MKGNSALVFAIIRYQCVLAFVSVNFIWSFLNTLTHTGPIQESKGMWAIFQEKGQKRQNIWKFGQKCTKFENTLKRAVSCVRLSHAWNSYNIPCHIYVPMPNPDHGSVPCYFSNSSLKEILLNTWKHGSKWEYCIYTK